MRKLLTFLIALAAVVGVTASSFGGSMGHAGGGGWLRPRYVNLRLGRSGSSRWRDS
jgi:hypothetical protein